MQLEGKKVEPAAIAKNPKQPPPWARARAIHELTNHGTDQSTRVIEEAMLTDPNSVISANEAAQSLSWVRLPEVKEALKKAMKDPAKEVSLTAEIALWG